VYILIVLSIITFFTGFLQDTAYEFIIYTFHFILLIGGVKLIFVTLNSKIGRIPKIFLFITGFSLTVFFIFFLFAFANYILFGSDMTAIMESLEGILYLDSLFALIGFIGSLICLRNN